MKERFEEATVTKELNTSVDGPSYNQNAETRAVEVPLPDVLITSRGFIPDDDLVTETRLRCWELVERMNFRGEVQVIFTIDMMTGWDDTYTATVAFHEGPVTPKMCGLGSDPYEALAHALHSVH